MVRSRLSTAKSRLRESISTFVPLFLSDRSTSRIPSNNNNLDNNFEYIGTTEQSDLYDAPHQHQATNTAPIASSRAQIMNPSTLSRSQTSSSSGSGSSRGKHQHTKRSHHTRTRTTRPSPTRTQSSTTTRSKSHTTGTHARTRPRRKITPFTRLRLAVESKFRLTLAFGLGFIASLVLYLGLFLSRTSSGTTFHVLSILLLIALLAIFAHSLLRFLALNTELKAARAHRAGLKKTPSARGWNISRPLPQFTSSCNSNIYDDEKTAAAGVHRQQQQPIGAAYGGYENDEFPVFNADDAARNYNTDYEHNPYDQDLEAGIGDPRHPSPVAYPPPTYGNTRTSVRLSMTPSVHSQHPKPDPNITAPAPNLAPGMPGWHPPSFRSEGGITAVLERRRQEVQQRLRGGGGAGDGGGGGEVLGRGRYGGGMI